MAVQKVSPFLSAGIAGSPASVAEAVSAFDPRGKRIYVAGHTGMVGSALLRRLSSEGCEIVHPAQRIDLRDQAAVAAWMADSRPDAIILAASKVGGIHANNSLPADFLYDNLVIQANLIDAAYRNGVEKLLFLGSSCIYPKFADQPISEEALLTGPLEPTNEWYALAKIAGVKLCEAYHRQYGCDFISAMPTNLYGPGDNYDLAGGHVLPALLRKAHEAKEAGADSLIIWGTGTPRREFLHVDDLADACILLLRSPSQHQLVNIGSGTDLTVLDLAKKICEVVGFSGAILTDPDMPDGTPRKLLDCTRLYELGWRPRISLEDGLASTYREYRALTGLR